MITKFNTDKIRKNDGGKYSDYSKNKFGKVLSKFYRDFVKKEGRGYRTNLDGLEHWKICRWMSTCPRGGNLRIRRFQRKYSR
jgi:hypothetical protein